MSLTSSSPFWNMTVEEVLHSIGTDREKGLSEKRAQELLAQNGPNTINPPKRAPRLTILLRQFTSPLILILLVAVVVTLIISHYRDALFILVAVMVNALLGFYQEDKAEQALSELKSYLKERSRVIRGGIERNVDAEELVIGDIVRLSQGDRVPADGRIIFQNDIQVDEAVLTGESLPVVKTDKESPLDAMLADQGSMVFAGTLVTQGVATVLLCRTGRETEFGKIASLIAGIEHEETPLQKKIRLFSLKSSLFLGTITIFIFIGGIMAGYSALQMFLTSVAIAVSAIPEGLPIALTVILSVGVQRMARRKGVVRKLVAAETLGSSTLILTDKTGTLTEARMELTEVLPWSDIGENELLSLALLNTDVIIENPYEEPKLWRMNGKIMETALVRGSAIRGIHRTASSVGEVLQSIPFNAVQKFSVSLVGHRELHRLVFFGAPDILLERSTLSEIEKAEAVSKLAEIASTGKRVLGIAIKEIKPGKDFSLAHDHKREKLVFAGMCVFHDPVRPGIKEAIAKVAKAGIRTVIMTGDHLGTAEAIAREVGLAMGPQALLDASEIALLSESELGLRLDQVAVIARVTPFDKLRIAKLYQAKGEVVAMTGDGVNDAPSIKQADVGIAMGSGTEVSRSVADLVLLDDNFETIVAAVEEGRQIMSNIRKVLVYLLSNVTDGLILIGGALLVGLPLPLNPLQILWVNFFSDSFPAVAFAFERDSHALSEAPQKSSKGLFDPLMRFLILVIGISTSALLFILYWALLRLGFDAILVRTFIFAAFGSYTLFVALSVRSLEKSIFSYPLFSNLYLISGILSGLTLMAIAIYVPFFQRLFGTVPLSFPWVLAVIVLGIANIGIIEIGKWLFRKKGVV